MSCQDLGSRIHELHDETLFDSANRSFFLSAAWIETWLDCFGSRHDLVNLAIQQGGALLGLAPLAVTKATRSAPLRRIGVAGQHPTSGEHLDLLAVDGAEQEVAEAVVAELTTNRKRRWDVLTIQRALADSTVMAHLAQALQRAGCRTQVLPTGSSRYVELPPTMEELLGSKSKNFRSQLRQSRNRLAKLGRVEIREIGDDLSLDEGLSQLVRLHKARWSDASSFDSEEKVDFHRRLSRRLADNDQLYLSLLTVDGETVGARYDFVFDDKIWCMQGGWDPAHSQARPGTFLTQRVVEWGVERGLREYDFLAGDARYKDRWSTGARDMVTLVAANPSTLRGRLYGLRMKRGFDRPGAGD